MSPAIDHTTHITFYLPPRMCTSISTETSWRCNGFVPALRQTPKKCQNVGSDVLGELDRRSGPCSQGIQRRWFKSLAGVISTFSEDS
jgi:hypothetical protein